MTSASKPPASAPPPSGEVGGSSTPYVIGIAIFAIGIVGLLYTKCSQETAPGQQRAQIQPKPKPTEDDAAALPEFAPPPPPEPDAGTDAGVESKPDGGVAPAKPGVSGTKAAAGSSGPCSNCNAGKASSALVSAVRSASGTAQGCHKKALRKGAAAGRMNVAVVVGASGNSCGTSITSDTVGNPAMSACVLSKFQRSWPKPESGCVTINVPINFAMK